jgi:hypothetical protein
MWAYNPYTNTNYYNYSATQTVPQINNQEMDGQCWYGGANVGFQVCPGFWQDQTVWVTESNGYNYYQFYLRGYGATISHGPVCTQSSDFFGQVFEQTGVICCSPPPSNCCNDPSMCSADNGQCNADCYCIPNGVSPIIIDTTGHGFHLTSAEQGVRFDFFGTGKPLQLSWTDANSGNGFLALDRNGNGRIDNAKELFGNITEQPKSDDPNGYLALAEFDKPENGGNGDGIIDFHDAVYSKLLIWIDANHDGVSQPEELHSLPSLGVYSIGLKFTEEPRTDEYGNKFRYRGVLNPNPLDGTSRDGRYTYDVFFVRLNLPRAGVGCKPKPAALPLDTIINYDPLRDNMLK